jgi:hypothetical protein
MTKGLAILLAKSVLEGKAGNNCPPFSYVEYSRLLAFYVLEHQDKLELPGWICKNCKAFNGEAKEKLMKCRCCEKEKERND